MLELIIIAVIVYCIIKAIKKSGQKKKTTSAPTRPAAKPAAKPTAGGDFPGVDKDAFARAMAHMSEDSPAPAKKPAAAPKADTAADEKWVREHPFTQYLCEFYTRAWGREGGLYQKVANGEIPILKFDFQVQADQIHETITLKEGGSFESDTTFASFDYSNDYPTLNSAAKRTELRRIIAAALETLPTIQRKNDGFYVLTGSAVKAEPKKEEPKPAKPAEPKKPASGGDEFAGIDKDAFARAMAAMSGDAPAPKKEEPKPAEPPKPEPPKVEVTPATEEHFTEFMKKVVGYYYDMWNKESGTLYTELDTTMPIDHFAVQVRETCLVESVWLKGDEIPLVTETEYTKICGGGPIYPMTEKADQTKALVLIAKFLVELGTVEVKGNDFYPIRKSVTPPAEPKKPDAPADEDQEAKLRAQVQAMLEAQMRGDNPEK